MKVFLLNSLWILTSVLFMVSGFYCIWNPDVTILSLAILLGISLFISGLRDICTYIDVHNYVKDSGWILMEGIITLLFSIFCFMNHYITVITIPVIFTIWVIFTGISRIVSAIDFKTFGFSNWWFALLWGILLVAFGMFSVFDPIIASVAISVILGIILISQGISSLIKWYYANKIRNHFKQILK